MTWSLENPKSKKQSVGKAKELLAQQTAPQSIKDYVTAGIDGLVAKHGGKVLVSVNGHGKLCDGNNFMTDASLEVKEEK